MLCVTLFAVVVIVPYLGCLPLHIYMMTCHSCAVCRVGFFSCVILCTSKYICGHILTVSFAFVFVSCFYLLFLFSVVPDLPGDDFLRWLFSVASFPSGLLFSLIFFSERALGLVWFTSFCLVTTAGFVRSLSVDVRTCIIRAFVCRFMMMSCCLSLTLRLFFKNGHHI